MIKTIGWVVQNNLTSDRYVYEEFKRIFQTHNIAHEFVEVIPFDENLPEFDRSRLNIFYGSTTMMNNVYRDVTLQAGLFFDDKTFSMDTYFDKWKDMMLNFGATITTFGEIENVLETFNPDEPLFIRPVDDSKSFDGQIMDVKDLMDWKGRIRAIKETALNEDTKIVVGTSYKINKEWRNFIVNGKVIGSSRYMKNQRLSKDAIDVPEDMIAFCEKACAIYQPHDIFVMDIAETGGEYFILECGCINSAGFYNADIEKIVLALTSYLQQKAHLYQSF